MYDAKCSYKWFTAYSQIMLRLCVGCNSNRGLARAVAQAWEKVALAQSEFASCISHKQAAIPLIPVVSGLI